MKLIVVLLLAVVSVSAQSGLHSFLEKLLQSISTTPTPTTTTTAPPSLMQQRQQALQGFLTMSKMLFAETQRTTTLPPPPSTPATPPAYTESPYGHHKLTAEDRQLLFNAGEFIIKKKGSDCQYIAMRTGKKLLSIAC